jgi:hypothetical protein
MPGPGEIAIAAIAAGAAIPGAVQATAGTDVIKFHGHGGYGDNMLAVAATGFVSNDNDCNISPWGGSGTSPEEPRRTCGRPCTCTVASIP